MVIFCRCTKINPGARKSSAPLSGIKCLRFGAMLLMGAALCWTKLAMAACGNPAWIWMAATGGSKDLMEARQLYPHLNSHRNFGISLTNGSLGVIGRPAGEVSKALDLSDRPYAVGMFYNPEFTPSVDRKDYGNDGGNSISGTALIHDVIENHRNISVIELDITLSSVPNVPGIPLSDAALPDVLKAITDLRHTIGHGTVMPWIAPNDGIYGDFAGSPVFANERRVIHAAGGVAIDVPAGLWIASPPAYRSTVISMIRWAHATGAKTMFSVSPFAAGPLHVQQWNYDDKLLEKTQLIYRDLMAAKALPDEWLVQNYAPANSKANQPGRESDSESLSGVALWLADHACRQN